MEGERYAQALFMAVLPVVGLIGPAGPDISRTQGAAARQWFLESAFGVDMRRGRGLR